MHGQAALEYLTTYGWAILVVLVAIGALAYFGVMNPYQLMPSSCTVAQGFDCSDFKVTSVGGNLHLNLFLHNSMGVPIQITSVNITCLTCQAGGATGHVVGGEIEPLGPPVQNPPAEPPIDETFLKSGTYCVRYSDAVASDSVDAAEFEELVFTSGNPAMLGSGGSLNVLCKVGTLDYVIPESGNVKLNFVFTYLPEGASYEKTGEGEVKTKIET